jgi:hypothetical protein
VRQHGIGKRRTWRKLHLAVDAERHEILGVELTRLESADCEVLPALLQQNADQPLASLTGDGAYNRDTCREVEARGATAVIPPRRGAALWEPGHPRNAAVETCRNQGRSAWKRTVGYHRRSNAETAMFRYKQILGPCLTPPAARHPDHRSLCGCVCAQLHEQARSAHAREIAEKPPPETHSALNTPINLMGYPYKCGEYQRHGRGGTVTCSDGGAMRLTFGGMGLFCTLGLGLTTSSLKEVGAVSTACWSSR